MELWYRKPIGSTEFKKGLNEAPLWQLKNLKVAFALEQRNGEKVSTRLSVVSKEVKEREMVKK